MPFILPTLVSCKQFKNIRLNGEEPVSLDFYRIVLHNKKHFPCVSILEYEIWQT